MPRTYYYGSHPDHESMLAYLLDEGVAFCDGDARGLGIFINLSDTFVPAADSMTLSLDALPTVFELHQKHGYYGLVLWAAPRVGQQPRQSVKQHLIQEGLWTEDLERLTPNTW